MQTNGDLTLIELLIHTNPEVRQLAQQIAQLIIDERRDEVEEVRLRCVRKN